MEKITVGVFLLIVIGVYTTLKFLKIAIHPDLNNLLINLTSGMVVVFFTVWLVDSLIRKRKDKRLKDLNKEKVHWIVFSLNRLMFKILLKFNLISEKDIGKNYDFENAYEEFKKTSNIEAILKTIREKSIGLEKEKFEFLKSFYDETVKEIGFIRKQIEEIKPYPKPEIIEKVSDIARSCGFGDGANIITDIYLQHPEFKNLPDNAKFEKGLKALQEILFLDKTEVQIKEIFNSIILIRDATSKNELHCDIY